MATVHYQLLCTQKKLVGVGRSNFRHGSWFQQVATSFQGLRKEKQILTAIRGNEMSKTNLVTGGTRSLLTSEVTHLSTGVECRQKIPIKKQLVDPFRQGIIIEGNVGYRQTLVIRSYEVGADKTATLESILNLLQETALNHVWVSGLLGDGFGATRGMVRNNLIWVVSRMQVQVDEYPIWGEVMEVDTWVGASGKNGMRRDWIVRSYQTGQVLARATSTWVMMNKLTRRLSKIPEEVRAEISPWFIEKKAITEEIHQRINKLDSRAKYVHNNLKAKRSDLDMNHHVNNVKYVNWMLETIPCKFLENYQLCSITMEYRRECGSSDMVQSLCEPEAFNFEEKLQDSESVFNRRLYKGEYVSSKKKLKRYTHLLQVVVGDNEQEEIVRGRTTWKRKV